MNLKNPHFNYLLNWILLGLVIGLIILLFRGDIQVSLFGKQLGSAANNNHTSFSHAVQQAAPAVVSIQAMSLVEVPLATTGIPLLDRFLGKNSPHGIKTKKRTSSGSGVILDAGGYVLTNYHVIAEAEQIEITLKDGRSAEATLVGKDPDTDLAVLKLELDNLPEAKIATITDVQIGDVALAIGYPFEIGQTVTQGIISATGRTRVSDNAYENYLQTDAAINPGNSGGALINVEGEIVGINSLIYTETGNFQGIGFAIPIDLARFVLEQITTNGYVIRGWLGVAGQALNPEILKKIDLNTEHGILVTDVDVGGPGDKAGLKPGDIIISINQQDIVNTVDIMNIIAAGKPGDEFDIQGIRKRQSFSVKATLGQRPLMSR